MRFMRRTFPVIWSLHGCTHTGRLEVTERRIVLTSRECTLAAPRDRLLQLAIERDAGARIRGLTPIKARLGDDVVLVASLGGVGSLHEIAALLAPSGGVEPLPQGLAGAGT